MLHKLCPYFRKLLLVRLTVCHCDASLRQKCRQTARAYVYGLHTVVDVVHLPTTAQLLFYGLDDDPLVKFHHIGLYRISVDGGLLDDTHITYAAHCHIEGAGYGCSGESEHIYPRKGLLEALLVLHTEALLLVYYGKAYIVELHILLHQTVSTYDHIHRAYLQPLQNCLLLLGGAKP